MGDMLLSLIHDGKAHAADSRLQRQDYDNGFHIVATPDPLTLCGVATEGLPSNPGWPSSYPTCVGCFEAQLCRL